MALRFGLLLACVVACIAAAPPMVPGTSLRPDDLRVASVGYRLGLEGRRLCPDLAPLTGLQLHHLLEYDGEGRVLEIANHGLDRGPGVLAVVAASPAADAGLRAGDVLLALNGQAFPDPTLMRVDRRKGDWRRPVEESDAWLESGLRRGPAVLSVLRDGAALSLTLGAIEACPARVRLARSDQGNAFSTGTHVVVTTRMLRALHSDDELAIVIGHELAHNILGHKAKLARRAIGKRAAEDEADRLGLRLAAAAGYDLAAAIPMWRRLQREFGTGLPIFRTHPSAGARERLIEQTVAELGGRS